MRIVPKDQDMELARALYAEFSAKPGSKHIASEYALAGLSSLLNWLKPTAVLEIGAGIGTLTRLLMTHPVGVKRIVAFEDNDFCYEQLTKNLPIEAAPNVEIIRSTAKLEPMQDQFQLMVLDGVHNEDWEPVYAKFQKGAVVYFEGVQKNSRGALPVELAARGLRCDLTNNRPPGRKFLTTRLQDHRFLGMRVPKIRVLHKVKGYWVGRVEEAEVASGSRDHAAGSEQLEAAQSTSRA
ncbi:MAG: hypothetical protein AAGF81_13120 [Pseudomonadota bacterium]